MLLSIILGYLIGVPITFFLTRQLLRALAQRMATGEEPRRWIRTVGGVLGALALAPAIFAGVIFAGYMGQRPGGTIGNVMGMQDLAVPTVVGVALAVGTFLIVAVAATLGAGLGLLMSRAIFAGRQP